MTKPFLHYLQGVGCTHCALLPAVAVDINNSFSECHTFFCLPVVSWCMWCDLSSGSSDLLHGRIGHK